MSLGMHIQCAAFRCPAPDSGKVLLVVCRSDLPIHGVAHFPLSAAGQCFTPLSTGTDRLRAVLWPPVRRRYPSSASYRQIDIDGSKIRRILFGGKADIQRLPEPVRRDAVTFQSPLSNRNCPLTPLKCAAERHPSISLFFRLTCRSPAPNTH